MYYTPSLDRLADDILIQILQTSKCFYSLSKVYCVWYAVFCAKVLAYCLPPPGPSCSLSALSSANLEYWTLLALALERHWSQSKANVIVSSGEQEIVDQIMLVPGGMQVLTVHGHKVVWWLISGKPGSHELHNIGAWSLPSDDICIVVKNMEHQGIIAISSRDNLKVLDWYAKTEGTALLPHIPELFSAFLGLVHFLDHILVTWKLVSLEVGLMQMPCDDEGGNYPSSFLYWLLWLSMVVLNIIQDLRRCMQICLGSSGHGLFVYEGKFGPKFEMERVIYEIETVGVGGGDKINFDKGMGQLVVVKESGGFDVIQLL
ncbi:hypothetical protein BDR06DRAFT_967940 [Suillus hirtellus]|nr:hypothetical protein BDR06DRAFT_967940 [Suillus hirtellus]